MLQSIWRAPCIAHVIEEETGSRVRPECQANAPPESKIGVRTGECEVDLTRD